MVTSAAAVLARRILIALVLGSVTAISVGAAWLSFLATRSLAELVGWDPGTAWLVMPVIELFFLAGTAETALRELERRDDVRWPSGLTYMALLVSLVLNVVSHVAASGSRPGWQQALLGCLAGIVPLAQIGGLHLLADRLRALGERRRPVSRARLSETRGETLAATHGETRGETGVSLGGETRVSLRAAGETGGETTETAGETRPARVRSHRVSPRPRLTVHDGPPAKGETGPCDCARETCRGGAQVSRAAWYRHHPREEATG